MVDSFLLKEVSRRAFSNLLSVYNYEYDNLTFELIEKMKRDDTVKSCMNTIINAVSGKDWFINSNSDNEKLVKEVEERFNDVNFNNFFKKILISKYDRYSVQEIIWNEDLTIKEIKSKPREWFGWSNVFNGWVFLEGTKEIPLSNYPNKFIVTVNDPDDNYPEGRSELEAIMKLFDIKENAMTQFASLVKDYGKVITWFSYDMNIPTEIIEEQAEVMSNLASGDVIGVPQSPNRQNNGKDSDFGFITLDDLKSEVHGMLLDYVNNGIKNVLLGTSAVEKGGSYASAIEQGEIRTDIVNDYTIYTRDNSQLLITYDANLQGYNRHDLYFSLEKIITEEQREKIKKDKAQKYLILKNAGYQVKKTYVSKDIGIPENEIELIPVQNFSNFQQAEFQEKKKTITEKKFSLDTRLDNRYLKSVEVSETIDLISDAIITELKKIKKVEDLENFSAKYPTEFENNLLFSNLYGRTNVKRVNNITKKDLAEFQANGEIEQNIFNAPYQEAIEHFTSLDPQLFDDIENIEGRISQEYFWVKKSTDLEVTKKMKADLEKSLEEGETFKSWLDRVEEVAIKNGFGHQGYYLKTVYETNMQSSYNSGRSQQQLQDKDIAPYVMYNGINDSNQSEICQTLDGSVWKVGSVEYDRFYPPNHYNCRSNFIQLTKEDLEEMNLKTTRNSKKYKELDLKSFEGNPTKRSLEKTVKQKEKEING